VTSPARLTDPRLRTRLADGSLAGVWTLDPSRSTAALRSKSIWGLVPVKGSFGQLSGEGAVSETGEVSGEIRVGSASIDTKVKKRDAHLRSADFFDSDTYPHIIFKAQRLTLTGEGATVTGTLQVRDRTLPLTLPVAVSLSGDEAVQLDAEVGIDRSDFGLTWDRMGAVSMKNTITFRAVFTRH
jgi:polyisoprenoid-binding protein YceI